MPRRLVVLLTALCAVTLLGASCGETNIHAIERLRPRGTEAREKLGRVVATLPPAGSLMGQTLPTSPLVPRFVLDFRHGEYSADVLMEEQAKNPDANMDGRLDLMLSPHLLSCLLWTGPRNPLDESVWDDSTGLGPECEKAFATRWLVIVRTVLFELPERVRLEVFVVDFAAERVMARFPIELRARRAQPRAVSDEALRQLRSDAFVAARCELGRRLAALGDARVDLSESWLDRARDPCAQATNAFLAGPQQPLAAKAPPVVARATKKPPAPPRASEACREPDPRAPPPASLREVDWCNRDYVPSVVSLRAGRGELHEYAELGGIHDTDLFELVDVAYGDIDGDGEEEAVVAVNHQAYVGAEQHSYRDGWLFLFDWHEQKARELASVTTTSVTRAQISDGHVIAEIQDGPGTICTGWERRGTSLVRSPDPPSCGLRPM